MGLLVALLAAASTGGAHSQDGPPPQLLIELDAGGTCLNAAGLSAAVASRVGADYDLSEIHVSVYLADTNRVAVELHTQHRVEPLLRRLLPFNEADCPHLPRLFANILSRRIQSIPAQEWRAHIRAPIVASAGPGAVPFAAQDPLEFSQPRTDATVTTGLMTAPNLDGWAGAVDLMIAGGLAQGPFWLATLGGDAGPGRPLGSGSVQVSAMALGLGAGYRWRFADASLASYGAMRAGAFWGRGASFAQNRSAAVALIAPRAGVSARWSNGFSAALNVDLNLVQPRYEATSGAAIDEPRLRIGALIGYWWYP